MKKVEDWQSLAIERYQALSLAHGALVLLVGLVAGLLLLFSMLKGFVLWPIMDIPYELPGSVRGWKAAHVGGLANGLLIMGIGLTLVKLPLSFGEVRVVFWSMVLTGWGNTLFYWGGNLSPSRAISVLGNDYGESNVAGILGFIGGGAAMPFTIVATGIIALAAFRLAFSKRV